MTKRQREKKRIHKACEGLELNRQWWSCNALGQKGNSLREEYEKFIGGWWPWRDSQGYDDYFYGTDEQRKTARILALLLFHETRWLP